MTDAVSATTPDTMNSPLPTEAAPAVDAPVAVPSAPMPVEPPARYELALEGFTLDPALLESADPLLRQAGLSNEAANALLPVARTIMDRTQETLLRQIEDAAATQKKAWYDAFVTDPEIGGARRSESEHLAARALDALGYADGHPFRRALDDSGFGNHPDMIRAFRRLGEMLGEDATFVRPGVSGGKTRPVWERLYPEDAR